MVISSIPAVWRPVLWSYLYFRLFGVCCWGHAALAAGLHRVIVISWYPPGAQNEKGLPSDATTRDIINLTKNAISINKLSQKSGLKMFLDLVGFISTHFQPKPSHGDPFQAKFYK